MRDVTDGMNYYFNRESFDPSSPLEMVQVGQLVEFEPVELSLGVFAAIMIKPPEDQPIQAAWRARRLLVGYDRVKMGGVQSASLTPTSYGYY